MTRALSRAASAVLAALVLVSGLGVLVVATAPPSEATHFRATQLAWHRSTNPSTPRLVEFHFSGSFRRSYFTQMGYTANVGTSVPVRANDGISGLFFGDGQRLADFNATVVSVDLANDQLTVDAHLLHTYPGTATAFTAYYQNCCRLSLQAHRNNPDRASRQETLVNLGAGVTASPESGVSPIVDCPVSALCQFFVPATDTDGAELSYRLATSAEASGTGNNSGFVQPRSTNGANVAFVHPTTGLYSWNTTGADMASGNTPSYFSTQVVVEKKPAGGTTPVSKLAVDFFIRVNPSTSPNQPPVFVSPPTPANGATIEVVAGRPATFDVRATDANNNATVTLGTLALPAGATFTTTNGNPATATFTWTPTVVGQTFVTLTAQDQFGLQATQRTVRVLAGDGTPPVITGPGDHDLQATGPGGAVASFSATALDETSGARPVTCAPASGSTFPIGQTTITCTAADAAGNTATSTGVVTVVDTAGPVLSLSNVQAEATGPAGAPVTYTSSADDAVDGPRPVSCSPLSGSTFPIGPTTVSCSSADTRGNVGTGTFVVTVSDTTAPVLVLPGNLTAEATGPGGAAVAWTASASDAVDGAVSVACNPASGAAFALGATPVACGAADAAGNGAEGGFSVRIVDTTGPAVQYTGPTTVEATGPGGASVTLTGTATDLVDGDVAASCTTPAGATLPLGVHLVTCTAVDAAGNPGTMDVAVAVVDTVAPVVSVPADATVEAVGPDGAPHGFVASAADAVTPDPATSCTADSDSTFPLGATVVTCTATDGSGNLGTARFRVTVVDTTGPTITTPGTVVEEATGPNGAVAAFAASATDLVDGAVPVACTPASGATFALGTTMVTCNAEDSRDNQAVPATIAVVVRDTTAPTLLAPPDQTEEASGPGGATVAYPLAVATDAVDTDVEVVCSPAPGTAFALGTTPVACSATDDAGNRREVGFAVHVVDTTPPSVTTPPDVVVEATSGAGAAATYATATASDVVDGAVPVDCVQPSGSIFPVGTSTVTCTARDRAGNTGSDTFKVTVEDTTAPTVAVPADVVAEATGPAGAAVSFADASALDLVDGAMAAPCQPPSGSVFDLGTGIVTCQATDTAGNTGRGSFAVTVRDTTPPTVSVPADAVAEATGPAGAAVSYPTATATDLVDGAVEATCSNASGATFRLGATIVTCTAVDARGNTGTATFNVTVRDTTAPTITAPGDLSAEATGPGGAPVSFAVTATDAVDGTVAPSCSATSGATFVLGTTTVSCSATDTQGNAAAAAFTITVRDTIAPVVTYAGNKGSYAVDEMVQITCTASDGGSGVASHRCVDLVGPAWSFGVGRHTRSASAVDVVGNEGTGSTTFTVVVSSATLCNVTRQFVTKAGVAHSLCVKLDAARSRAARGDTSGAGVDLTNYRNEVKAQAGKALTAEQAATLDALAAGLAATW